jgi:hypothetical protein
MDLNSVRVITCRKVIETPITEIFIKATMAEKQGFKTLKFKTRYGITVHNADLMAGVEQENDEDEGDNNEDNNEEDNNEDIEEDNNLDREEYEDEDLEGLDDVRGRDDEDVEPRVDNDNENEVDDVEATDVEDIEETPASDDDTSDEEKNVGDDDDEEGDVEVVQTRKSSRASKPVERLEPTMMGKSFAQYLEKIDSSGQIRT